MSDLTDIVADKEFRAQCERAFRSLPAATQRIINDATLKVTWAGEVTSVESEIKEFVRALGEKNDEHSIIWQAISSVHRTRLLNPFCDQSDFQGYVRRLLTGVAMVLRGQSWVS